MFHFYLCRPSLALLMLSLRAILSVNGSSSSIRSGGSSRAAGSGGGGNNYRYGSTTRHSYSLSTFSPNGDIDQIVRAMRASMLGLPLLALSVTRGIILCEEPTTTSTQSTILSRSSQDCKGGSIYLCLPQRYLSTSPLCIDSGTPHILQLTSSICLSHTGISADGRSLLDYAVELTLDYRYIYGVEMPLQELLMGLADKMMEMTRRAGWRPYGCALLVMSLGDDEEEVGNPTMYRVDPSGVVVLLNPSSTRSRIKSDDDCSASENDDASGTIVVSEQEKMRNKGNTKQNLALSSAAFLGNWDTILSRHEMDDIRESLERRASYMSEEEIQKSLVNIVGRKVLFGDTASANAASDMTPSQQIIGGREIMSTYQSPMLFASFTRERGLQISRIAETEG